MADIITVGDVPDSVSDDIDADTLAMLIAGLNARASRVAPCLADSPTEDQLAEAKLVLIGALVRWAQSGGPGSFQQETYGPFSVSTDTRSGKPGYNLWPTEIEALQDICRSENPPLSGAFQIDTLPDIGSGNGYWSDPTTWVPLP